jgi:hypothetical protein
VETMELNFKKINGITLKTEREDFKKPLDSERNVSESSPAEIRRLIKA